MPVVCSAVGCDYLADVVGDWLIYECFIGRDVHKFLRMFINF